MITTQIVKLTPELATSLLAKNSKNRPISKSTVDAYVRAIRRGEWALNGEPIIVFTDDTLGDGQHRCLAVQKAGIPIDAIIMYGIAPDTFGTLNAGKPRNSSDILAIKGELNTRTLTTATRAYLTTQLSGRDAATITALQIEKCVDEHPHLRYWVQRYVSTTRRLNLFPSSLCGYLAVASEKYGIEKLDSFLSGLTTGVGLVQGDPALVLRDRFIAQTRARRLSATHAQAFIVKAINAHLLGKKLPFLRLVDGEATPKIV